MTAQAAVAAVVSPKGGGVESEHMIDTVSRVTAAAADAAAAALIPTAFRNQCAWVIVQVCFRTLYYVANFNFFFPSLRRQVMTLKKHYYSSDYEYSFFLIFCCDSCKFSNSSPLRTAYRWRSRSENRRASFFCLCCLFVITVQGRCSRFEHTFLYVCSSAMNSSGCCFPQISHNCLSPAKLAQK